MGSPQENLPEHCSPWAHTAGQARLGIENAPLAFGEATKPPRGTGTLLGRCMLSPTEITRDKIPLQEIWKHFPNFLHLLGANLAAGLNSLLYGAVTHTGYQNQWGLCSGFV